MSLIDAFTYLKETFPDDPALALWIGTHGGAGAFTVFGGNDAGQINDDELPGILVGDPAASPDTAPGTFCGDRWTVDLPIRFVWKDEDPAVGLAAMLALIETIPVAIGRDRTLGGAVEDTAIVRIERDQGEQPTFIVRADLRLTYEIDGG